MGETLIVAIWPGLTKRISLKLDGIDTTENRGSSDCEKIMTRKATEFTSQFVTSGTVAVSDVKLGKYAGRVLGDVTFEGKGLVEARRLLSRRTSLV